MATAPATPAPGPLEQSLAQRAGADAQTAADKGSAYAQSALTYSEKGVQSAQGGVDHFAAGYEVVAAKIQAALDNFKQHSAAGQVGSIVQNAIEHLTDAYAFITGALFQHKAAAGIPPDQPLSPAAGSATTGMAAPKNVPTAATGVPVSNVQAEDTKHLPVKSDVTSKV